MHMFHIQMSSEFPLDMSADEKAEIIAREKAYGQELQNANKIVALWRVVGPKMGNIAIYDIDSPAELHDILSALPMRPYLDIEITPIAPHPSMLSRV